MFPDLMPGSLTLRCLLVGLALFVLVGLAAIARAGKPQDRTRGDVEREITAAEDAWAKSPSDPQITHRLARLLFEAGDFQRSAALAIPAAAQTAAIPTQILHAAEIKYLMGRYADAEQLYRKLLAHPDADKLNRTKATVGLAFVYYQTNRFDRFRELDFGPGIAFPAEKLIRNFETRPYQIKWPSGEHRAEVPFLVTDPLPVLTVRYDGRPVHVLFDTGADMCILDSELAREFGVAQQGATLGGFGGGKLGRMAYGKLRTLEIGNVMLEGIPIWIMPTRRFSAAFGKQSIDGIIGTALVRQFLATLDYEHAKLVLRERSPSAKQALRAGLGRTIVAEIPFVLTATHWMMARGSLNGRDGLTFFVDSGLAADAAFSAPPQTLRDAGIPEPPRKLDPASTGGGGGPWASGRFAIESLGLGPLRQSNLHGEFGAMTRATYWQNGFIQDGLISHRFLRKYASWSIDFDEMKYIFAGPATP